MKTTPITERTGTLFSQPATAKKKNAVARSLSVAMTVAAARDWSLCCHCRYIATASLFRSPFSF